MPSRKDLLPDLDSKLKRLNPDPRDSVREPPARPLLGAPRAERADGSKECQSAAAEVAAPSTDSDGAKLLLGIGRTASMPDLSEISMPATGASPSRGAALTRIFFKAPWSCNSAVSIKSFTSLSMSDIKRELPSEWTPENARAHSCFSIASNMTCLVLSGCVKRRNLTSIGQVVALITSVRKAMPPVKNRTRLASCSASAPPALSTLTWMARARPTAPRRPPHVMMQHSALVTSWPSALRRFRMGREQNTTIPRMTINTRYMTTRWK
mmetsp:Transcript_16420/g.48975  ORF Transcript_16420/g.48975 Transcript_16420/m.48975 type:complete len:267 (+) Transcript_16420:1830-2630(+)